MLGGVRKKQPLGGAVVIMCCDEQTLGQELYSSSHYPPPTRIFISSPREGLLDDIPDTGI